jgi:hypothetical protein
VKAQFTLNADMLGIYNPRETEGTCPPLVLLRSSEGFSPPGISNVPQWLADRSDPRTGTFGWESLAGDPIRILDIPGHHFTPFKPDNVGVTSVQRKWCSRNLRRLRGYVSA